MAPTERLLEILELPEAKEKRRIVQQRYKEQQAEIAATSSLDESPLPGLNVSSWRISLKKAGVGSAGQERRASRRRLSASGGSALPTSGMIPGLRVDHSQLRVNERHGRPRVGVGDLDVGVKLLG